MFYGYESSQIMPSMNIYDTSMMQAYISGAREQYNQAKEDLKEFFKTYNDFQSPVYGAQEAYANLTTKRAGDAIAALQAQGIDPLRNAQGRAAIQHLIMSTDYGKINQLKQQADDYKQYQAIRREMVAKGLTTDDFEDWRLRQQGLDDFTALDQNGNVRDWTRLTPEQYTSVDAATNPWFEGIGETYLGTEGNWDIYGIGKQQLENAADRNMYDYLQTQSGRYNYENFARNLGVITDDMSQQQIDDILRSNPKLQTSDPNETISLQDAFKNEIINRHDSILREKKTMNKEKEMDLKYQYSTKLDDYKTQNEISKYNSTHSDSTGTTGASSSGSTYASGYNSDGSYDSQRRLLNEGLANLLGVKVSVIDEKMKDSDLFTQISSNQGAILANCIKENGNIDVNKAIRQFSKKYDISLIAKMIGLDQTSNDKESSVYSLPTAEIDNLYSMKHLVGNIAGTSKKIDGDRVVSVEVATPDSKSTSDLRNTIKNHDSEGVKCAPTGRVVCYMSKDGNNSFNREQGAIKMYAEVKVANLKTKKDGAESEDYPSQTAYIDLGTVSTDIVDQSANGVHVNRDRSTLRANNFEEINRSVATKKNETTVTDYH